MSCMWCNKFVRDSVAIADLNAEDYVAAEGLCHLNPEPVAVSGKHVCSHFQWERMYDGTTAVARFWISCRDDYGTIKALKAENKKLREKLKSKRATLPKPPPK